MAPRGDEPIVDKRHSSAFHHTDLHQQLCQKEIDHVVIVGLQTEYCVDSACRTAVALDYRVTLVEDGHTTYDHACPFGGTDHYAPQPYAGRQPRSISSRRGKRRISGSRRDGTRRRAARERNSRVTGRCLCGDIRYEYSGAPVEYCIDTHRRRSPPLYALNSDAFCFTKGAPLFLVFPRREANALCALWFANRLPLRSEPAPDRSLPWNVGRSGGVTTHPFMSSLRHNWDSFEIADALPRYAKGQRGASPVRHGPRQINVLPRRAVAGSRG